MCRVTLVLEALRDALSSSDSPRVFGLRRDAEDLIQVLSAHPDGVLSQIATVHRASPGPNGLEIPLEGHSVWLELNEPIVASPELDLVELRAGLDSRRGGALAGGLHAKSVTTFGGGSIGAPIALMLAQAGVRQHQIIDNDLVDVSNISRHPCDLLDLGRSKADALADLLRRRAAQATPRIADVCSLSEPDLDQMTSSSDLVIIAMDSPQAQFLVNESCVRTGTAAVVAAAYERACAGEVLLVRPWTGGPCLYCATGFRAGLAPGVTVRERRQAYQAADANRLVAEPGLAADIASIAAVAAAYTLAVLDPTGSRAPLLDAAKAFVLVHGGSVPRDAYADLFQAPFDLIYARVTRDDPCPVCGYQNKGE